MANLERAERRRGAQFLSPFAELELLKVLLHGRFGVRRSGHAGGKALRLLHPQLMPHAGLCELLRQSAQLQLALHLEHHLHTCAQDFWLPAEVLQCSSQLTQVRSERSVDT